MTKTQYGVNLGGWLVLEKWLTPTVFKGTSAKDEYGLMTEPDAKERIRAHRDTFMTEEDWQWLAKDGIKLVRLPVGYWVLQDDEPFQNAQPYLDWAFEMAEKYEIKILLDLHALKGSQNGTVHSGRIGKVDWWRYRYESLRTVQELARRYKNSPALWGIEIINEPTFFGNYFKLLRYYRQAYKRLRKELQPGVYTVFHDAFVPPFFAGALWPRKRYPVIMDSHYYVILGSLLSKLSPERYDGIRGVIYRCLIFITSLSQPVIVGEWGSVMPQPMFDRVEKSTHLQLLAGTIARQKRMYHRAQAALYWNYKAEGRGMYHYRSLREDGVIAPLEK
jgi:glucan 1,3-beta-glucosidase